MAGDKTCFWEHSCIRLGSSINERLYTQQRQGLKTEKLDAKS